MDISSLVITPEMLSLISEIDEFKGAWKLFERLSPVRLNALRKVATIESVGSSTRIEGSKLSDIEVEKLLSKLEAYSFKSRDEQEVAGYAFVCEEIFSGFDSIPFTENTIKQLHGWLLKYSEKDVRHRGEYKKVPNDVQAIDEYGNSLGVLFETASPFDIPFKMQDLIYWTRESLETKSLHPLIAIGIFVVVFLAIHPFQDGNGRLSRCLTTLLLLQTGYAYVPYSSIESIIEDNKESYYLALRRTQQSLKEKSDFIPWLHFFLRTLQKQKKHLEQKITNEKALYLDLPQLSSQIIELISKHGHLSIKNLETMLDVNRNTLKKHLQSLVSSSHLTRVGKGRATTYTL